MAAFLLDANLSIRIVASLAEAFPGTLHVGPLGLDRATDTEIWEYARGAGLAILSKDSDFRHLSLTFGAPPKFVWLRLGNCSTDDVVAVVLSQRRRIDDFLRDEAVSMLVLDSSVA